MLVNNWVRARVLLFRYAVMVILVADSHLASEVQMASETSPAPAACHRASRPGLDGWVWISRGRPCAAADPVNGGRGRCTVGAMGPDAACQEGGGGAEPPGGPKPCAGPTCT